MSGIMGRVNEGRGSECGKMSKKRQNHLLIQWVSVTLHVRLAALHAANVVAPIDVLPEKALSTGDGQVEHPLSLTSLDRMKSVRWGRKQ